MAANLNEYLKSEPKVVAARKKLSNLQGKVSELKTVANTNEDTKKRYAAAVALATKAEDAFNNAKSTAIEYFNANKESIVSADVATKKKGKAAGIAEAQRISQYLSPEQQQAVQNTITKVQNQPVFEESPKPGGTISGSGGLTPDATVRNYATEMSTAAPTLISMSDPDRLRIAKALKAAGFNVPITGTYNEQLVGAYQNAIGQNQNRNKVLATAKMAEQGFDDFLKAKASETAALATGTGTTKPVGTATVSGPTDAAAYINQVFKSELNRDATADEIKKLTKSLNKAQQDPKNARRLIKGAGGIDQYTTELNPVQFLTDAVRVLPEFATKKTDTRSINSQDLLATVRANGLPVDQSQLDAWAKEIENGKSVDVIKNGIRKVAAMGMPDNVKQMMNEGTDLATIYAPYKTLMASTLELNPSDIQLSDPTLRMAIGPDKEMTTYDFNRALRKDTRWQYTDNAHQTISDAAMKVLQDFGFKG